MAAPLVLLAACSGVDEDAPRSARLTLPTPDQVFSTRAVVEDNLRLDVSFGDETVPVARDADGTWSASFDLPPSGSVDIVADWFERVTLLNTDGDVLLSEDVQLVRSDPLTVDAGRNQSVRIDASSYRSAEFDADNDGTDNLTERRDDLPVFDPREPASTDHDCRQARFRNITFPAQEFELISARTVAFDFAASTPNEIQDIVLASGETVSAYLDSIALFRPGTLSVRHVSGTPSDTRVEIYRTNPDPDDGVALFSDPASDRADIRLAADAGLYCLVLYAGDLSADRTLGPGRVEVQLE